jgi:hypothetical protein
MEYGASLLLQPPGLHPEQTARVSGPTLQREVTREALSKYETQLVGLRCPEVPSAVVGMPWLHLG